MPSVDLLPRTALTAGETLATEAAQIASFADVVTLTVMRFAGEGDLACAFYAGDVFLGGGSSPGAYVETIDGPFQAGVAFRAELTAAEPIEAAIVLAWG